MPQTSTLEAFTTRSFDSAIREVIQIVKDNPGNPEKRWIATWDAWGGELERLWNEFSEPGANGLEIFSAMVVALSTIKEMAVYDSVRDSGEFQKQVIAEILERIDSVGRLLKDIGLPGIELLRSDFGFIGELRGHTQPWKSITLEGEELVIPAGPEGLQPHRYRAILEAARTPYRSPLLPERLVTRRSM